MTTLPEHIPLEREPGGIALDEALLKAKDHFDSPIIITGGSGHGWSKDQKLLECPYKFYRRYREPIPSSQLTTRKKDGLNVGSCYHAFQAYLGQRLIDLGEGKDPPHPKPSQLRDFLYEVGAEPHVVREAWRLLQTYVAYYDRLGDPLEILAVEKHVEEQGGPPCPVCGRQDTARYDRIVRVDENAETTIVPGIWIQELKTASRFEEAKQAAWHLDGEVLKQVYLWGPSGMEEEYGPLQGVIVDLVTKTKTPTLHRELVSPPWGHAERQMRDIRIARSQASVYQSLGYWPRNHGACWARYGPCEFFEHCRLEE